MAHTPWLLLMLGAKAVRAPVVGATAASFCRDCPAKEPVPLKCPPQYSRPPESRTDCRLPLLRSLQASAPVVALNAVHAPPLPPTAEYRRVPSETRS